jgi:class 3 adenylate cyclase/tetratricopeptide (TPR) repeat protein
VGCGRCGAPLADGDLFCGDCGAPVRSGCLTCGEPLTPGKRFCRRCGATLFEPAPASSAAASAPVSQPGREPAAERRVCSVLFCDVVGFTPLSESRDPETVRELLSQYFAVARTVISRYGGVVEKFIGDAVMAVWGTPVATEGDAERAVRAALDLVAAVAELGAESGLPALAARAGVVTGEVAVNLGAVGEGMVAGDAVNTASRVQSAAGPGAVLVDVPTQRLTGSAIAFAEPERGSYRFSQEMLRQVAYDTLSRRDRKARHLAVAAHLRAAFPGDGEEVTDVIARHYLDALNAIPDAPDAAEIRGRAVAALTRAAERAERTGAPAQAAASYAAAAELSPPEAVATLWERAAQAALAYAGYPVAVEYSEHARGHYLRHGEDRAAARVQALAGRALSSWGRHAEAREQLTAAVEVLRERPDTDTVSALTRLATVEVFVGSPDADRLSAESLTLGQALGVGPGLLAELLVTRGLHHLLAERRPQAISYFRESARLAAQAGDNNNMGRALLNLADTLMPGDPAAAVDAARTAAGHLRRTGQRRLLAAAIMNVAESLLQLGDWDAAEAEMTQAMDSDALADMEDVICDRGWLAALRGDTGTAEAMRAALRVYRSSEDPQDQSLTGLLEAFTAAARRQPADALRHSRAILALAEAIGISSVSSRWAWPLAARCAYELGDTAAARELLDLLDSYQSGHLAPMLRAERDLIRARLAVDDGDTAASFTTAIAGLRAQSTPYHLAHGLLDHAEYLLRTGDAEAATAAIEEARDIAGRLRCQPLLDRAAALTPPDPVTAATQDSPRATS